MAIKTTISGGDQVASILQVIAAQGGGRVTAAGPEGLGEAEACQAVAARKSA